jgi:hypothetical protein
MTRNGKIARLPRSIRDELNRRLQDGEPGDTLLPWVNGLPEVQAVLARQFGGSPISKQNLHEWRSRGFAEWQTRQETLADARELAADAAELETATEGRLTDHLATVLAARYASAVSGWDGQPTEEFRQKLKVLRGMCQDIVELRRGDHSGARLQMERDRIEEKRKKNDEEMVAHFETWAKKPAIQDWLCQTWVTPQEREKRKREIFGLPPLPGDEASDETKSEEEVSRQTEKGKVRKMREIFGMAQEDEAAEPDVSKMDQTDTPPEDSSESGQAGHGNSGQPPESSVVNGPEGPGSNPVKASQTTFSKPLPGQGHSGPVQANSPSFSNGRSSATHHYEDDT